MKRDWHLFVSTPNNGQCSSCSQRRSALVHQEPGETDDDDHCKSCGAHVSEEHEGDCESEADADAETSLEVARDYRSAGRRRL